MNEALQPPKFERVPVVPPQPLTLETANKPLKKKGERVEYGEEMMQAMGLLSAKTDLEARIKALGKKALETKDAETSAVIEKEMADLNDNLDGIVESLARLRPEFGGEVALQKILNDPSSKEMRQATKERENKIAKQLKTKNDLEERANKLRGALRLDTTELAEAAKKGNVKRSDELEPQIRVTEDELRKTDERRLKAWKTLSELDPKTYAADAALEASIAESPSDAFIRKTEKDIADSLRDNISQT